MLAPETPQRGREKRPGAAARPISVRLTEEEKRLLLERAGSIPLATYIRNLLLQQEYQAPRRRARNPVKDQEALARVLAALGQSRIANNLNQLAKAANIGALAVAPETEHEIREVCEAVAAMRRDLMRALGLIEGGSP